MTSAMADAAMLAGDSSKPAYLGPVTSARLSKSIARNPRASRRSGRSPRAADVEQVLREKREQLKALLRLQHEALRFKPLPPSPERVFPEGGLCAGSDVGAPFCWEEGCVRCEPV